MTAAALYRRRDHEAPVLASVMLLFVAGALAAVLGPARPATAVDPLIALKTD